MGKRKVENISDLLNYFEPKELFVTHICIFLWLLNLRIIIRKAQVCKRIFLIC
jgi:hypothetical protein